MKHYLRFSLTLLGLTSAAAGFPAVDPQAIEEALHGTAAAAPAWKRLLLDVSGTPVEVTGEHAFLPPDFDAGDQRGPCPGLNALANHGYIRRDGVASLADVTLAINGVYGMGIEIAALLSVLGTVFVGNPLSLSPGFSIGSSDPGAQNLLDNGLGLLGEPRGLNGSHNIIESDSSGTRADLYVTGDASTMDMALFRALYDEFEFAAAGEEVEAFDVFARSATARFNESVATNPNFYFGPWTGLFARNAGYFFAARLFSNYSSANPQGVMTQDILKSFYAVEGDGANMTYKRGHERIPENWYRRPVDYGLVSFNLDLLELVAMDPRQGSIGGNAGSVNSFVGVDLGDVTGGLLDATSLLEGNNLLCFTFEVVKTLTPSILSNLFATVAGPLEMITDAVGAAILNMSCPAFADMTFDGQPLLDGLLGFFPGANVSQSPL